MKFNGRMHKHIKQNFLAYDSGLELLRVREWALLRILFRLIIIILIIVIVTLLVKYYREQNLISILSFTHDFIRVAEIKKIYFILALYSICLFKNNTCLFKVSLAIYSSLGCFMFSIGLKYYSNNNKDIRK